MKRNSKKISCSLMLFLAITALAGCTKSNHVSEVTSSSAAVTSNVVSETNSTSSLASASSEETTSEEVSSETVSSSESSSATSVSSETPVTKYTVTYIKLDGTEVKKEVEQNALAENLEDNNENISFVEWQDANNGIYDFDTPVTADITLHAVGRITISYDSVTSLDENYGMSLYNNYRTSVYYRGEAVNYTIPEISDRYADITYDAYSASGLKLNEEPLSAGDTISVSSHTKLVASGSVEEINVFYGEISETQTYMAGNSYISITSEKPISEDEKQYFVGWKLSENGEVYRAGDKLLIDEFVGQSEINFEPYFVDTTDALFTSDFDELICDGGNYEVIVLTDDIDADGSDTDTGIGDGEYNGIILGNGHTISNFTINADDTANANSGLIDTSTEHLEVYDLTLDSVALSSTSSFGAGYVVGEADGSCIFENVIVTNCTIDNVDTIYWSENYYDSIKKQTVVRDDPINNAIRGLGAIAGTVSAVCMKNCEVKNWSSEIATETSNDISSSITIGGLIGSTYVCDELEAEYGVSITSCSVTDSKLYAREKVYGAVIGGLIGSIDCDISSSGTQIYDNEIVDDEIEIYNCASSQDSVSTNMLGGLIGYNFANLPNKLFGSNVPNYIYRNNVAVDITANYDADAKNNSFYHDDCIGGIFGYTYFDLGSNNELGFEYKIEQNSYDSDIEINSAYSNVVRAGGFAGYAAFDNEDHAVVLIDNNYVATNIELTNTSTEGAFYDSRVGGFIGYAATGSSDESFVTVINSNVVIADISVPNVSATISDNGLTLTNAAGGLFGVFDNDFGQTFITNNIASSTILVGGETYDKTSAFYYVVNNVMEDQADSQFIVTSNKVSFEPSDSDKALNITKINEESENPLEELGLSKEIWIIDDDGTLLLRWIPGNIR